MAIVSTYLCVSCNTDLGAKGTTVESHLASNPTHTVREVIYNNSSAVSAIQGRVIVYNNIPFAYDASRTKWLSVMRYYLDFGIPATGVKNLYMRLYGFMTPASSDMGYRVKANATITKLVATRSTATGATFSVRQYGGADIASIAIANNVLSGTDLAVNADVAAGTNLSAYLAATGGGDYNPQLVVELAWRI
jgi:hypothetical protein